MAQQQKTRKQRPRISATPRSPVNPAPAVVMSPEDAAAEAALREDIRRAPKNAVGKRMFDKVPGLQDRIRAHVADQRAKGRTAREICDSIDVSATWLSNLESAEARKGKQERRASKATGKRSQLDIVTAEGAAVMPIAAAAKQAAVVNHVLPTPIPAAEKPLGRTLPLPTGKPSGSMSGTSQGAKLALTSYEGDGRPFRTVEITQLPLEWLRILMGDLYERGVFRDLGTHEVDHNDDS